MSLGLSVMNRYFKGVAYFPFDEKVDVDDVHVACNHVAFFGDAGVGAVGVFKVAEFDFLGEVDRENGD
jgi:hypothetical protein